MRYSLYSDMTLEEIEGSLILIKGHEGVAVLDSMGKIVLGYLLQGGKCQCIEALLNEYDVDKETLKEDIDEFAARLVAFELISECA